MEGEPRPRIRISEEARKDAADRVVALRKRRAARRTRKRVSLARRLDHLHRELQRRIGEASRVRGRLGAAVHEAIRREKPTGPTAPGGKSLLALDRLRRQARFYLETGDPAEPRDVLGIVITHLGLQNGEGVTVRWTYPGLVKRRRELGRFHRLELETTRRATETIRWHIADALRRSGHFVSVRAEGLGMGLFSGGGGNGESYEPEIPDDVDWHLTSPNDYDGADYRGHDGAVDVYGAWEALDGDSPPGSGIVVGHPDSGFRAQTNYPADRVLVEDAYNAMLGVTTPPESDLVAENVARHPIEPRRFPYFVTHGTQTASVIVAPPRLEPDDDADMVGVAPGARILPLRCIDSVVLAGDAEIIDAVAYAIEQNVDVLSISLGGAPNPCLRDALAEAVEAGIIVVAASGQSGDTPLPQHVAAPAAYPEVIAIAGAIGVLPWQACFHGAEVDACAPAVHIRAADFKNPAVVTDEETAAFPNGVPRVRRLQGTSFAAAITAGAAALWLQHHGGRAAIEAAVPGVPVQQLFRHLLKETAVDPTSLADDPPQTGWDHANFGAGLLNVRALLRHPLPAPDAVPGFESDLPFNPYVSASGLAILDLGEDAVLDTVAGAAEAVASGMAFVGSAQQMAGDFFAELADGVAGAGWILGVAPIGPVLGASHVADDAAATLEGLLAAAGSVGGELGALLEEHARQAETVLFDAEDKVDEALADAQEAVEDFVEETGEFIEKAGEKTSQTANSVVDAVVSEIAGIFS